MEGDIISVIDIRKCFHLQEREIMPDDRLIIVHTAKRKLALVVDSVDDITKVQEQDIIEAEQIYSGLPYISGALRCEEDVILILDVEKFPALDEEPASDERMQQILE